MTSSPARRPLKGLLCTCASDFIFLPTLLIHSEWEKRGKHCGHTGTQLFCFCSQVPLKLEKRTSAAAIVRHVVKASQP